jgi:hypothetical protein
MAKAVQIEKRRPEQRRMTKFINVIRLETSKPRREG